MELLLFLSALLASLLSGDRTVEARQMERAAVSVAADFASAVATEADEAVSQRPADAPAFAAPRLSRPTLDTSAPPQTAPVDERRLE
ncbi:MAG TPA: hypothetical protein VGB59_07525 [Allosphingosinicella sp.]